MRPRPGSSGRPQRRCHPTDRDRHPAWYAVIYGPETIRSATDAGPASDCYGWGATMYHLATGEPPFKAAHSVAIITAHLQQPPPLVRRLAPKTPAKLATSSMPASLKNQASDQQQGQLPRPRSPLNPSQPVRPQVRVLGHVGARSSPGDYAECSRRRHCWLGNERDTECERYLKAPAGIEWQDHHGAWQAWPEEGMDASLLPAATCSPSNAQRRLALCYPA